MLLVVKIDVSALAATKMRILRSDWALSMSFAGSFSSAAHASSPVRACMLARYLDDLNVQVLDGSAEDPVVLLCPHLLHRVADSGRRGGRLHR